MNNINQKNIFQTKHMSCIATIRFNETTWNENCLYKEKYKEVGCIYGPSRRMTEKIPLNTSVFIVEMNNSTNQIEGIGLIKNCVHFDNKYKIYSDGNYNRYIYKSKYRLDRSMIDYKIVELFDHILFKEKTHLKRGCGFTRIPDKLFQHKKCAELGFRSESEIRTEITLLFQRRFSN